MPYPPLSTADKQQIAGYIIHGNNEMLRLVYASHRVDPDFYVAEDTRLIRLALNHRNTEAAKILLDANAGFLGREHDKKSPLDIAIETKQGELFSYMVTSGIRQNLGGAMLPTLASASQHIAVRRVLQTKPHLGYTDIDGNTLLHFAGEGGSDEIIEMFLKGGLHPNAKNHTLVTPLMLAAQSGWPKAVRVLLNNGASTLDVDREMNTTTHYGGMGGNAEILKMLIDHGAPHDRENLDGRTPLCFAAASKDPSAADYLLDHGANPNPHRFVISAPSPLHNAAEAGNVGVVTALIRKKAKLNAVTLSGTPLHYAAIAGHKDVVTALILAGASTKMRYTERSPHGDDLRKDEKPHTKKLLKEIAKDAATIKAIHDAREARKKRSLGIRILRTLGTPAELLYDGFNKRIRL